MSDDVAADWGWADGYVPLICQAIGPLLMKPAPLWRDRNEAVDLMLLNARAVDVAVRMRRPGYLAQYPFDFTIRDGRPSLAKTELTKILQGFGDWLFYGHAAAGDEPRLAAWMLLDLRLLRYVFARHPKYLHQPEGPGWGRKTNPDGTSWRWFDVRVLQDDCPEVLIDGDWPDATTDALHEVLA